MRVPDRVVEICRALWSRDLAEGDDDARRALTRLIAEQVAFELGPQWGTKRADPGRPPSKDAVAYQLVAVRDGQVVGTTGLLAWDWQNGTTREVNPAGEMQDITGQVFIPVAPTNHLGESGAPPEVPPPVTPPEDVLGQILARLSAAEKALADIKDVAEENAANISLVNGGITQIVMQNERIYKDLANRIDTHPTYKGSARFIGSFELRPEG